MGVIIGEPHLDASAAITNKHLDEPVRAVNRAPRLADRESVEALYVRLAPELIRFATTLVGPSDAEDLLASAMVKAISSARWDGIENHRAYLYRALVNEAHKSRRLSRRRTAREIRIVHRDSIAMTEGLDPDVMACLKRLTVRQRAVIHLTYWADLTPPQVADILATSPRTVERELTHARHRPERLLS